MMVGRYGTQHLNTGRQMWMCDCTPFNADNHIKTCKLMDNSKTKMLSGMALQFYISKDEAKNKVLPVKDACSLLKDFSQYVGDNAFDHVLKATDCLDDCTEGTAGIFRMTPMCGLHFIAPGLGKSIVDTMLGAMSIQSKANLDRLVIRMFTSRRQSGRDQYPIPNLSKGMSNTSKKTSDEWMGVVFYLGIVFRSGIGRHILTDVIQNKYINDALLVEDKSIIELFEDRPAIETFGYMLECTSTFDAYNKKKKDIGMPIIVNCDKKVKTHYYNPYQKCC